MQAFKSLLDPSWDRLGPFWVRSWGQKSLIFIYFKKVSWKLWFLTQIRFEMTFWWNLGDFWRQKGSKKAPKWDQTSIPNWFKNMIDFYIDFGSKKGRVLWDSAPTSIRAGPVEGVRGRHKSLPLGTWIRIWLGFVALETIYTPWGHSLRSVPRRIL